MKNIYNYKIKASEELTQGNFDFDIAGGYHYIMIGDTTVSQLKKAGIIPNKKYLGLTRNKPDGMILLGHNDVRVLVEYKKDGVFHNVSEALEEITDWYYKLALQLDCHVICVTDGEKSYWFHAPTHNEITYESGHTIGFVLNTARIASEWDESYRIELLSLLSDFERLTDKGVITELREHNPQSLAKNVWQKIWITTGKQPEQCLYNVVEIFLFKYLSDLGVLEKDYNFDKIYSKSEDNPKDALIYYADNVRKRIKQLFPPSKTDGTSIINGTIFVNEEGKANTSQAILFRDVLKQFYEYNQAYGSFRRIDKNFKTRLYENFLRRTAGLSTMGQFFTPRNVVQAIIAMTGVHTIPDNAAICDPFCGVGGFLLELLNEKPELKSQFVPENGLIIPQISLTGYDKGTDEKDNQRTIILAKANMLIYLSDIIARYSQYTDIFSTEVFNKVFHLIKSNVGTFGITADKNRYDLILTNPPFVTSGVSIINDELKELGVRDEIYTVPCKGLEGLALEWIIYSLKEGGTAFIIVPEGVMRRNEDNNLRNFILSQCILNAIISLPTRTFFATPQDTYILSITKKRSFKQYPTDYNIFSYLVSEIGETRDANRFTIAQNDLLTASRLYRQFYVSRDDFDSEDKRFKLITTKQISNNKWTIADRWSDDEKKALGIEVSESVMSEKDFFDMLDDLKKDIDTMVEHANSIDLFGIRFKTVLLSELGSFSRGNGKYTRKYCHEHYGPYPVYSADTKGTHCIGSINTYDHDTECVTVTTNGHYAGTPNYIEKSKFSMNGDCGCFILNSDFLDTISYRYIAYALMNKRAENGFNWKNKPSEEDILNLEIKIPVDNHGQFDINIQSRIVERHAQSEMLRHRLLKEIKRLNTLNIDILS